MTRMGKQLSAERLATALIQPRDTWELELEFRAAQERLTELYTTPMITDPRVR